MPPGENGHCAAKHVVMETERGFDLVFLIAMMLHHVIKRMMKFVMLAIVSPFRPIHRQQQRK